MDNRRLVEIKVLVEVESDEDVETITDAIEKVICPHPLDAHPAKCPNRWFIVSRALDPDEAAAWEETLNE